MRFTAEAISSSRCAIPTICRASAAVASSVTSVAARAPAHGASSETSSVTIRSAPTSPAAPLDRNGQSRRTRSPAVAFHAEPRSSRRLNSASSASPRDRGSPASPGRLMSKTASIAFASLLGIAIYLVARFAFHTRFAEWALIAVLLAGVPLLYDLLKKLAAFEVGADALAGISIITAAILGEYLAGAIIVLMLSGGTALELYATRRASAVLSALAKRVPSGAHRLTDSGIVDVALGDVQIDDRLVVLPHEICPVDGAVVDGRGTMDESYLTGEPFQIAKAPG